METIITQQLINCIYLRQKKTTFEEKTTNNIENKHVFVVPYNQLLYTDSKAQTEKIEPVTSFSSNVCKEPIFGELCS